MARGATPASWRSGVSGNPAGRPRKGETLTEAVRAAISPWDWAERVLALAEHAEDDRVRLAALSLLADRGWGKPHEVPAESEFTAEELAEEARIITAETLRAMPPEERIKLLADPAPTDTIQ